MGKNMLQEKIIYDSLSLQKSLYKLEHQNNNKKTGNDWHRISKMKICKASKLFRKKSGLKNKGDYYDIMIIFINIET